MPKAWNAAHSTAIWKAQNSTAPSSAGSRVLRWLIASRTPADIAAGAEASCWASRPTRPLRLANGASRRSRSVGTMASARQISMATRPITAGTNVNANGSVPAKRPQWRPNPQITTAAT